MVKNIMVKKVSPGAKLFKGHRSQLIKMSSEIRVNLDIDIIPFTELTENQ